MNNCEVSSEIKYSSKVIIIDRVGNIYLEYNKRLWWVLSFFWWWREKNETQEMTAIRELKEELWISIWMWKLKFIEVDWPKYFNTWTYVAFIYVVFVSDIEVESIMWVNNVMKFDYETLSWQDALAFAIERGDFLSKINKALNLRKN